jgi:hypothetical protein
MERQHQVDVARPDGGVRHFECLGRRPILGDDRTGSPQSESDTSDSKP